MAVDKDAGQAAESHASHARWWQAMSGPCAGRREGGKRDKAGRYEKKHDKQTATGDEHTRCGRDASYGDDRSQKAERKRQ